MNRRSAGSSPYDMGHDPAQYDFAAVYAMADLASSLKPDGLPRLMEALHSTDSAVRYWGVLGILMWGHQAVESAHGQLLEALDDSSPDVQAAAAETLGRYGTSADLTRALSVLIGLADWSRHDMFTVMTALNALSSLREKAEPIAAQLATLPTTGPMPDRRCKEYVPRLLETLQASLAAERLNSN